MTGGTDNNRKLTNTYTDKSGIPISSYSRIPQQTQVKTGDTPIWGKILSYIENSGTFANFLTNLKEFLSGATTRGNQTALKDHTVISLGTKVTLDYMEELQEGATKTAEANKDNPSIKKNIENNLKQTITDIATLQKKESEVRDLRNSNFYTNDKSKLQELHQGEKELNIMRTRQTNKDRETRNERSNMSFALRGIGHELMGKGEIKDKNVLYPDIVSQCEDNIKYGGYNTLEEFITDFTMKIIERAIKEGDNDTLNKTRQMAQSGFYVLGKPIKLSKENEEKIKNLLPKH